MTRAANVFTKARAPKLTVGERIRSIPKPKPVMLVPSDARVMRINPSPGVYLLVDPSTMREVTKLNVGTLGNHHRLGKRITIKPRS